MYTFLGLGSIVRELITSDLRQLYLKKRKIGLAQGITWRLAVKGLIKHPKLLENPLSTNIPCTELTIASSEMTLKNKNCSIQMP